MSINYIDILEGFSESTEAKRSITDGLQKWQFKFQGLIQSSRSNMLKEMLIDLDTSVDKINIECGRRVREILIFLQRLQQFSKLLQRVGDTNAPAVEVQLNDLVTTCGKAGKVDNIILLNEIEAFTNRVNVINDFVMGKMKEMKKTSAELEETIQILEDKATKKHKEDIERVNRLLTSVSQGIVSFLTIGGECALAISTGGTVDVSSPLSGQVLNAVQKMPLAVVGHIAVDAVNFIFEDRFYPEKEIAGEGEKKLLQKIKEEEEDLFALIGNYTYIRSLVVECLLLAATVDVFWKASYVFFQQLSDSPTCDSFKVSPEQFDAMIMKINGLD